MNPIHSSKGLKPGTSWLLITPPPGMPLKTREYSRMNCIIINCLMGNEFNEPSDTQMYLIIICRKCRFLKFQLKYSQAQFIRNIIKSASKKHVQYMSISILKLRICTITWWHPSLLARRMFPFQFLKQFAERHQASRSLSQLLFAPSSSHHMFPHLQSRS